MMTGAPFFADIADLPPDGRCLWLMTDDGIRLRAAHWPGSGKGTVFLLPGRTEYIEKYAPPAAEFCRCGWDVLTLDWRGQGMSDRALPDRRIRCRMGGHRRWPSSRRWHWRSLSCRP